MSTVHSIIKKFKNTYQVEASKRGAQHEKKISKEIARQTKRAKFTGAGHVETGGRGSVDFVLAAIVEGKRFFFRIESERAQRSLACLQITRGALAIQNS